MTMKLTKGAQTMSAPSNASDDGLFQTPPADSVLPDGIDRRSLCRMRSSAQRR